MNTVTALPDLSTRHSYVHLRPSSFTDWLDQTLAAPSPDHARSMLYYGFQPLMDALVDNQITEAALRTSAVELLDEIIQFSSTFISGYYYTGEELPPVSQLETLRPALQGLDAAGIVLRTKTRNIGLYDKENSNLCTPKHVQDCLVQWVAMIEQGKIPRPNAIVGCACGSSELVMAASVMLGIPLAFIRRSKRRSDPKALLLPEHKARLKAMAKEQTVAVVEDFVCTGQTLLAVMKEVAKMKPATLFGLSLTGPNEELTSSLKITHTWRGRTEFHAYAMV